MNQRIPTLVIVIVAALAAAGRTDAAERAPSADPTFTRDIAPIVYASCAPCHRPGESAPFSLLDYEDVRGRARQVALVTATGFMPPWLPAAGDVRFRGERRLTAAEIDTIRRWVEAGAPAGDHADLPRRPTWTEGWHLGEPDLVVTLDRPFTLPAEGLDAFRNFVLPVPVPESRWVRAVELRPGNSRVVHHAVIQVDRSGSCRRDDAKDEEPGFEGMSMGRSVPPDGHFLGWTPGRVPFAEPADMAWRLDPDTDLVVQLHMVPTGKPEEIRPSVGLYFAPGPPARRPTIIMLRDDAIDIPPGATDAAIEDDFVLPVPVEVMSLYPHAHYLGKEILATATLPDGTVRTLIHIPDWDFNWQDEYRLADPLPLPAGTTLAMRFTYDNSAENVRNPNRPPQRVEFGERSVDEMGTLTIQVLPGSDEDRRELDEAYRGKMRERFVAYAGWKLERDPDDVFTLGRLGSAQLVGGDVEDAIACFEKVLALEPKNADAHIGIGGARGLQGRFNEAIFHLLEALEEDPDDAQTQNNVGVAYMNVGKPEEAIPHFRHAVRVDPRHVAAHVNLGTTLAGLGRVSEAIAVYRRALASLPDARLHHNLANAYLSQRRPAEAIEHYREALRLAPGFIAARCNLGSAYASRGEFEEAIDQYEQVLQVEPGNAAVRSRLGTFLLRRGRLEDAKRHFERAIADGPNLAEAHFGLAAVLSSTGDMPAARPHFLEAARLAPGESTYLNSAAWILATTGEPDAALAREALGLAERAASLSRYQNASILDTLAAAYATAGSFDRAVRTAQAAIGLATSAGDQDLVTKLQGRLALYRRNEPYRE